MFIFCAEQPSDKSAKSRIGKEFSNGHLRIELRLGSRDDLDYYWPEYGTIVFPRLRRGNVEDFCNLLRKDFETSVVPGRFFDCSDRFRMGVGMPTEAVQEALQQLAKGLNKFAAFESLNVET